MTILTVLCGAVVGLSLGLTGGGGAIFAVPLLVYALGVDPHAAIGVSLVTVGLTSFVGFAQRLRIGAVEIRTGLLFAVAGMLTAPLGAWLATRFPESLLLVTFALLMLVIAARMWRHCVGSHRMDDAGDVLFGVSVVRPNHWETSLPSPARQVRHFSPHARSNSLSADRIRIAPGRGSVGMVSRVSGNRSGGCLSGSASCRIMAIRRSFGSECGSPAQQRRVFAFYWAWYSPPLRLAINSRSADSGILRAPSMRTERSRPAARS